MNEKVKNKIIELVKLTREYKQEQLLKFADTLAEGDLEGLLEQITDVNFDLMESLFKSTSQGSEAIEYTREDIEPVESDVLSRFGRTDIEEFGRIGMETLSGGRTAAVTMAGGQGTRLGHNGPKGTFRIGLPIGKTLFGLQAERLRAVSERCGRTVPWYIMTSIDNHADTVEYFSENGYFGYPKKDIFFFQQGRLPMLSMEGKILLRDRHEIHFGPDGNGGVFLSLKKSGALEDMKSKNIEWVFFYGIDNALVRMADPVFIGYVVRSGKCAGSKSVLKKHPGERTGVFCLDKGRPSIIEYTELPPVYAVMTKENGELLFGESNILAHLFRYDVLCRIAEKGLPYHTALKKAACIDENGRKVEPDQPNAYKFETFIFDAFRYLDDMAVLRVEREKEFAPIKNRTGEDSPETAMELLMKASDE